MDGKGGDINEAARSIRTLAEHLDQAHRRDAPSTGITRLTTTGSRTLTTVDKAVKNFDVNPSRIIWGGGSPATDDANKPKVKAR